MANFGAENPLEDYPNLGYNVLGQAVDMSSPDLASGYYVYDENPEDSSCPDEMRAGRMVIKGAGTVDTCAGRIFQENLPRLCHIDSSLRFSLLTAGSIKQSLPQNWQIEHHSLRHWEQYLRPGRYFRRTRWQGRRKALDSWLIKYKPDIWHSTYYTLPVEWRGPVVITAYDLIYFRFSRMFQQDQDEWTRMQIRCLGS